MYTCLHLFKHPINNQVMLVRRKENKAEIPVIYYIIARPNLSHNLLRRQELITYILIFRSSRPPRQNNSWWRFVQSLSRHQYSLLVFRERSVRSPWWERVPKKPNVFYGFERWINSTQIGKIKHVFIYLFFTEKDLV